MSKTLPWSYSMLTAFETCPRRFYLTRISKEVKEPMNEAATYGNEVHKHLEHAVGKGTHLPQNLEHHAPLVDFIRSLPGQKLTEHRFGFTENLTPTTFFGKDTWCRGVIDVAIVNPKHAILCDYKTGKVKEDMDQLELFALAGFSLWPHVNEVHTSYIWLGHNKQTRSRYTKEDVPEIKAKFTARVERMELAEEKDSWPAKPSGLCRQWCPVGQKHCVHCGQP